MSVANALREATAKLTETSDTARLDAELLMAHALGVMRSDMLLRHMKDAVPEQFVELVSRRTMHEPIAYILGEAEFYGRSFIVTPDVLIPRSDSESVIDAALREAPQAARVLDMGTGSGALLLTILAETPGLEGVGIDASLGAVAVAAANAGRLGLQERAHMRHADWHQPGWSDGLGQFDLIIANPPYVETTAQLAPDVRDFEPASALFAGQEGLDDYLVIISQLRQLLTEGAIAVLEIGASQAMQVTQIAEESGFQVELRRDLADRPRALILR